ncbi:MAG: hypothetical protein M1830_007905 [Pleopsidium flavum]|nr:MAG: hypothetical protein M1830_007963 [Pleopsidium flavum]KAI9875850.1 MAG: hypothetical protein M1830_007905 [Pleopsidium flavum]
MSTSDKPTVAFFGATGGCALAALALALKSNHTCTALARSPSKLTSLLLSSHDVPRSIISTYLTIIPGDVKDLSAVKKALLVSNNPALNESDNIVRHDERIVDIIISGIGGTPGSLTWNPLRPIILSDPTICADATRTMLAALTALQLPYEAPAEKFSSKNTKKPLMLVISTTGLHNAAKRDLPLLLFPLYRWLLVVPHEDKEIMEETLLAAVAANTDSDTTAPIRGAISVRPSLLTNGKGVGRDILRVGMEAAPAIGYTVARADVGAWIFEEVIQGVGKQGRERWVGASVSLTS